MLYKLEQSTDIVDSQFYNSLKVPRDSMLYLEKQRNEFEEKQIWVWIFSEFLAELTWKSYLDVLGCFDSIKNWTNYYRRH